MTVMLIKATPCVKQPNFKPRKTVKFNILCIYDDVEWTDSIVASSARTAIHSYLMQWITRPAAQGSIDDWNTNFVVETDAWPYGEDRLEEVTLVYGRD
jgi:hypothetical protein